jgi:SAM-dependent methyltransferase
MTGIAPASLPIRIGSDADFTAVRQHLDLVGFTEAAVCARTGFTSLYRFRTIRDGRTAGVELTDDLDLLIRLFLDVAPLPQAVYAERLPAEVRAALERLSLVYRHEGVVYSSVLLYPTQGLYVVSDHTEAPPGAPALMGDVVYPAVTGNTETFMEFLPRGRCERFLEVCGGTGIAALAASRFADQAWTADITERAARFAEFNGRLNGLRNFSSLQGDMYQPAGELRFQRIAAHPPYIPAQSNSVIFRDGGEDGEQIVRRALLEGLPRLEPGGLLYLTCVASDRKEGRLEERLRQFLGPAAQDFDLLLVVRFQADPVEYRVRSIVRSQGSLESMKDWPAQVKQLGIEALVYSHIYLRHRIGTRPVFTRRRKLGPQTTVAEVLWALDLEAALQEPGAAAGLLGRRVRVLPTSSMQIRYSYADGWIPAETSHLTDWPFLATIRGPFWLSDLLQRCDGSVPVGEVIAEFKASGLISAEIPDPALAELVANLALNGLVLVEGLPALPPRPALGSNPVA